jgi:multiple sugar transport system substrate-binding protein
MDRIKLAQTSGPALCIGFILFILFIHVKKVLAVSWLRHCRAMSLGLLFLGCSSGPRQPGFTIAVNAGAEGDALKAAVEDYGRLHPELKIQTVVLPYASLFEKELLDVTFGTGSYDVMMMDDPWFPRMAEHGKLTPLDHEPDADFIPTCIAICREPYRTGQLYALPYVGNSQLFFYRKDLFDKYGLGEPKTWDDVLTAARTIGPAEKMFGYVMRAAQGNAVVADYMALFWSFGAEMFDARGNAAVNSAESIAALRFMIRLGHYAPPGYVSFNADEVSAHLLQGTAVQSINWPAWIPAMDDPAKSRVAGKIAYAPMPGAKKPGAAEIGNWLLGIPAKSRNVAAARDFVYWVTEAKQMRLAALRGNPPTRHSLFGDPELRERFRAYVVQEQSLATSRPRPRTPYWNEIENTFGIYLSKANSGKMSPEEAMDHANREIQAILERTR